MTMIGYVIVGPGDGSQSVHKERYQRLVRFGCDKVYAEKRSGVGRAALRQSLGHAFRALKAGDVFATDKIESIGRDDLESLKLCSALMQREVEIVAIDEGIDTRKDSTFREAVVAKLAENRVSEAQVTKAITEAEGVAAKTLRLKIREPEEKKIARMTADGKKPSEIAAALGVDETAIRRAKRRMGLKRAVLTADDCAEIVRKIDAGSTVAQLAAEYGVNEDRIVKAYRTTATERRKKIATARYGEIYKRIQNGESIVSIANFYGVSDGTIRNIRAKYQPA